MSTPLSVLLVDDNEDDRYILARFLRQLEPEIHVFEEEDGKDALAFLEDRATQQQRHGPLFPPSIVFLDLNMPLVGGLEFLERFGALRSADLDPEIVIFSSSNLETDRERALAFPYANHFLLKDTLSLESVREVLEACR